MGNEYHESSLARFGHAGVIIPLALMGDGPDPYWQYQWNFYNTGQSGGTVDADIDLELANEYFMPSTGSVLVAVLDDGFEEHEDFPQSRLISGFDYAHQDFDVTPGPTRNHGMSCVGLIVASYYNSVGIAGIASQARILGQKIVRDDSVFSIADTWLAKAFSDAVLSGARVINNSWGCLEGADCEFTQDSTTYWIRKADSAGVLVVFAVGNYGSQIRWPANLEEVLAVGATDQQDIRQLESNYGTELDLMAPSGLASYQFGNIWSLDQMDFEGLNPEYIMCTPQDVNYTCKFGGTSAACPQVAGLAALILQRRPDLVGQTALLRDIIRYSSERTPFGSDPGDTSRVDNYVGWGRLNADRALMAVVRGDANNNGQVTIEDAAYIIDYIFGRGLEPQPKLGVGDADNNGQISITDSAYIINYIFNGGPPPAISFRYDY